jgi:hypothetical protein
MCYDVTKVSAKKTNQQTTATDFRWRRADFHMGVDVCVVLILNYRLEKCEELWQRCRGVVKL